MERRVPTKAEVLAYLKEDRNWGRWGEDDQVGAVNMVTPESGSLQPQRLKLAGPSPSAGSSPRLQLPTTQPLPTTT